MTKNIVWITGATSGIGDRVLPRRTGPVHPHFMLSADESASLIWGAIPDQTKAKPVLLFGEPVGVTTQ